MLLDAPKALWRWAFLYIVSNKHSFALSVDHVGNIWGARKLCISYLVSGFLPHWFRLNFCLKIFKITLISLLIPSIISSSFIIFITVFDSTLCSQESVYFNLYHSQIWLSELKLESPFLYNCFSKGQDRSFICINNPTFLQVTCSGLNSVSPKFISTWNLRMPFYLEIIFFKR